MQTDLIQVWQLEEGDYFTLGSDTVYRAHEIHDEGTTVSIVVEYDDGEIDRENPISLKATEDISIVTSFEDDSE